MITEKYNADGNPFGVFCSNPECGAFIDGEDTHPMWSEDCELRDGILCCENCGSPVVPARREDE
jgi:hypothetical protein